jgi:hypothetical protein
MYVRETDCNQGSAMTQRDRQGLPQIYDVPPRDGYPCSPAAEAVAPSWQQIFRSASLAERERLLGLARQQGILFSHQWSHSVADPIDGQTPLAQVLSGRNATWAPLRIRPVDVADGELDPLQREAVAKALQTPDVCLIQGLPGTGKRRVAAEIIRQAAARGECVLLLAPRTGILDSVLERITSFETLLPVRCLDWDENLERMEPGIRRLTFAEQVAALREQALGRARQEALAARERLERSHQQEPLWFRLQELADARFRLAERLESLNRRKFALPDAVHRESMEAMTNGTTETSFQSHQAEALAPLRAALARADNALTEARNHVAALEKEGQERDSRLAPLRSLVEAKGSGRWWTPLWWRATFSSARLAQAAAFEAEGQQAEATLAKCKNAVVELLHEQERLRDAVEAERSRCVMVEADRRRADLVSEEYVLVRDRDSLDVQWREVCRELDPNVNVASAGNPEAVRQAAQTWRTRVREEEQQADFAHQWAEALEREADKLHLYLRQSANLVAATIRALPADKHFGDASQPVARVDLVILVEAQDVPEEEIAGVAGRTNRLVLIGEPASPPGACVPRKAIPGPTSRPVATRPSLLQRLWNALHCDPRRLPYAWFREGERLCCRLHSITPSQRQWIERESVADFPEIELRILAPPRKAPVLAEVLFPLGYSIQQSKEFIFRELEEWPISAGGSSVRWDEQPDRIVLRMAEGPLPNTVPVVLGAGVREMVGTPVHEQALSEHSLDMQSPAVAWSPDRTTNRRTGTETTTECVPQLCWQTCCLEFERAAGWHRERAEEWVQKHLGLVDLGRTVRLEHPYARVLPHLNGAGACLQAVHFREGGCA